MLQGSVELLEHALGAIRYVAVQLSGTSRFENLRRSVGNVGRLGRFVRPEFARGCRGKREPGLSVGLHVPVGRHGWLGWNVRDVEIISLGEAFHNV